MGQRSDFWYVSSAEAVGWLPTSAGDFVLSFGTYSKSERRVTGGERRTPAFKLALALQIGFVRMTGRLLEALRVVPPGLRRHLGAQFGIEPPELASLCTMYGRRRTLFEQQDLARAVLGFYAVTEAQRRTLLQFARRVGSAMRAATAVRSR